MKRQEGFYWVKPRGIKKENTLWEVGQWNNGHWLLTGSADSYKDSEFEDIIENNIQKMTPVEKRLQ